MTLRVEAVRLDGGKVVSYRRTRQSLGAAVSLWRQLRRQGYYVRVSR